MVRPRRRRRPILEPIEERALLSAGIGNASAFAPIASPAPGGAIRLDGALHGRFHSPATPPDSGATDILHGAGQVAGIGHVSVRGEVHGAGFIAGGSAQGDITLNRAGGTITIHLTSPPELGGLAGSTDVFTAGITAATGKYQGLQGIGSATLSLIPRTGGRAHPGGEQGSFTLLLKPTPLPL